MSRCVHGHCFTMAFISPDAAQWPLLEHVVDMQKFTWSADIFLHLQSRPVDMCLNNGTDCGLPAATAFCKYLGFDGAVAGTVAQAPATTATRALTGTVMVRFRCVCRSGFIYSREGKVVGRIP